MSSELVPDGGTLPLDEPGKLRQIVVPQLSMDSGQEVRLGSATVARLVLDATDQDDCAAYLMSGHQMLVAGSDYVRGPKFSLYELGLLDEYDIGWYLAGANLSDVAAMGAVPLGLLSVVRYPKELSDATFGKIIAGIRDCCSSVGARNVGGDIGSAERIILSASAFGVVEPEGMLTRSAAHPGQIVCLTGPTGMAGAAMRLANADKVAGLRAEDFQKLIAKWRRVSPRVAHGRVFAQSEHATACLDTSDGLKGALETLADSSKVAIQIDRTSVPVHPQVAAAADVLGVPALDLVFGDSVDFELVVTVSPDGLQSVARECADQGLTIVPIGQVVEGHGVSISPSRSNESDGDEFVAGLPGQAWRHDR